MQLYTVMEAAAIMKICRTKVYAELKAGRLEAKKAGRSTRITEEAIKVWISNLPPACRKRIPPPSQN